MWTCARAGHKHAALYDGVALHIMKQLQQGIEWSPSNVASVIYSCALVLCTLQHSQHTPARTKSVGHTLHHPCTWPPFY